MSCEEAERKEECSGAPLHSSLRSASSQKGIAYVAYRDARNAGLWEEVWRQRINARKDMQLPVHHQTDWDMFLRYRQQMLAEMAYPITDLRMVVDTVRPLSEIVAEIVAWLELVSEGLPS